MRSPVRWFPDLQIGTSRERRRNLVQGRASKRGASMKSLHRPLVLGIALASLVPSSPSNADVADFYRGKQIRIVVGSDAGGGYDAYARTIAAHLGRFISGNPTFVVQNMPGVGSLLAVNHVTNVAAKDGTTIGAI